MAKNAQTTTQLYSLVSQMVKHVPTMWETWVQSPGREDPLEKEMATHPSNLAWRIPWTEELGGLQSMGRKESDATEPSPKRARTSTARPRRREAGEGLG